jgi:glucokinase
VDLSWTPQDYVIAIDVGGTTIKTALVTEPGQIIDRRRTPTPGTSAGAVIEAVLREAESAVQWGAQRIGRPPLAVGVASAGLVDEMAGIALHSAALGWRDVPLRALLAARTGLPVVLGQDLRAAALAEAGEDPTAPSFLFVAIGTGLGAALVHRGSVDAGARGLAGELGHVPVAPGRSGDGQPRRCGCGARGCLETQASARALRRGYRDRTGADLSAEQVAHQARNGDSDAAAVWDDLIEALTSGLVAATALLDPGLVVFGGGVSLAGEQLLAPLRERLAARYRLAAPPPLRVSALGDQGAVRGAGLLGWQHLRTPERVR